MSTETQAVLAQVDMLAGVIDAACVAILRARVTGPLADVETAEALARLRTAKRLATDGASLLRQQVRQAELLAEARWWGSQQATRAEAAETELRELKRTQQT